MNHLSTHVSRSVPPHSSHARFATLCGGLFLSLAVSQAVAHAGTGWDDDFESYAAGPIVGLGGWESWDHDPATAEFVVTTDQAHESTQAILISGADDAVRPLDGYSSGVWELSAWQYVPSAMTGTQYFIVLNTYEADGPKNWSLQLEFDGAANILRDFNDPANERAFLTDTWVELRVVVDLDADAQLVYYNDELFITKSWTDGGTGGGAVNIAAVNLYGAASDAAVVYDDVRLDAATIAYDRKISPEYVFVGPGEDPGSYQIGVVPGLSNATTVELDMSMTVTLRINGTVAGQGPFDAIVVGLGLGSHCGPSGCVSSECPDISSPIGLPGTGPGRCDSYVHPVTQGFWFCECYLPDGMGGGGGVVLPGEYALEQGDLLTVELSPAAGSVPEFDTANDVISVTFAGVPCPADIDGSGSVDFGDLLAILSAWGQSGGPADLDASGTVDFGDILALFSQWGDCP